MSIGLYSPTRRRSARSTASRSSSGCRGASPARRARRRSRCSYRAMSASYTCIHLDVMRLPITPAAPEGGRRSAGRKPERHRRRAAPAGTSSHDDCEHEREPEPGRHPRSTSSRAEPEARGGRQEECEEEHVRGAERRERVLAEDTEAESELLEQAWLLRDATYSVGPRHTDAMSTHGITTGRAPPTTLLEHGQEPEAERRQRSQLREFEERVRVRLAGEREAPSERPLPPAGRARRRGTPSRRARTRPSITKRR